MLVASSSIESWERFEGVRSAFWPLDNEETDSEFIESSINMSGEIDDKFSDFNDENEFEELESNES
jgi:hypothetical protein